MCRKMENHGLSVCLLGHGRQSVWSKPATLWRGTPKWRKGKGQASDEAFGMNLLPSNQCVLNFYDCDVQ